MKHLAVVIATTPQAFSAYLNPCLRSLRIAAQKANILLDICLVVNNAPLDWYPPKKIASLMLINRINTGFTGAVNQGIISCYYKWLPKWFLIINDDTQVKPDFFETYQKALNVSNQIVSGTVLTPAEEIESIGLRYDYSGLAFPNYSNELRNRHAIFCGTFFFLSKPFVKHQLDRFGFVLNPLYFAYAEDLELSLRAHQQGCYIKLINKSCITHLGSKTAQRGSETQLYYSFRNLMLTIYLHWSLSKVIFSFPLLLYGQLYIFGMCLYKRYWLLYPKIWYFFLKNAAILRYFKQNYYAK